MWAMCVCVFSKLTQSVNVLLSAAVFGSGGAVHTGSEGESADREVIPQLL